MSIIMKIVAGIAVVAAMLIIIILVMAVIHDREISAKVETLDSIDKDKKEDRVDFSRLEGLPRPVQQYFRMALKDGQQYIHMAKIEQEGELTTAPEAEKFLPFAATQHVNAMDPGFTWNAKISMSPILHIRVVDSYIDGKAFGKVILQSAFTVDSQKDTDRLNSGALYRYLAEGAWYPTALLPENGVTWTAIDENRALATLSDSGITVSVECTFNDAGELVKIYTTERYGHFDGEYRQYPWEGHFSNYVEKDGMMIPSKGQVGWHLPEGFWLFWKGDIQQVTYRYAIK